MSQPPSYPGSGDNPSGDGDLPPTHSEYGQQSSYGQQPSYDSGAYGQQPSYDPNNPYGAWQGGNDANKGTDGLSIAAFVLSLTCCLSFVGVILGFVGLGRTKNGQRKGRWAAIAAIVVGIILTLVSIGAGVAIWQYAKDQITLDNAEVGQCANVTKDGDSVSIRKKDCSEDHDAQIVYVGEFNELEGSSVRPSDSDDFTDSGAALLLCTDMIGSEKAGSIDSELDGNVEYGIANEDTNPSGDEKFLCYVQRSDDEKIDKKIS